MARLTDTQKQQLAHVLENILPEGKFHFALLVQPIDNVDEMGSREIITSLTPDLLTTLLELTVEGVMSEAHELPKAS